MQKQTGYIPLFRLANDAIVCGPSVHSTEECARNAQPILSPFALLAVDVQGASDAPVVDLDDWSAAVRAQVSSVCIGFLQFQALPREQRSEATALSPDERAELEALRGFKAYVHQRLDDAGIPVDPPSPHRDAGCRIGGRLDVALAAAAAASAAANAASDLSTDLDLIRADDQVALAQPKAVIALRTIWAIARSQPGSEVSFDINVLGEADWSKARLEVHQDSAAHRMIYTAKAG